MNKEELKAKLLAEAEDTIEAMLEKAVTDKPMKMREIVALAMESGQHIETTFMATLSQAAGEQVTDGLLCEVCGKSMHHKGRRRRDMVTEAGETRLERAYYYCAQCKVGRFPPG